MTAYRLPDFFDVTDLIVDPELAAFASCSSVSDPAKARAIMQSAITRRGIVVNNGDLQLEKYRTNCNAGPLRIMASAVISSLARVVTHEPTGSSRQKRR